jgi:hypothetical protein
VTCGGVECGAGACRPDDPAADPRGCVAQPAADGAPCSDDGLACTEDRCTAGACAHVPRDAACAAPECGAASCRPGHDDADARGCVVEAAHDGGACRDDGVACTEDLCSGGECRHVARDERCGSGGECRVMTCEPASDEADGLGCVPGGSHRAGEECSEDEDPCTGDVCRDGECAHEGVPDMTGCAPVRAPFRRARELLVLTRALETEMAAAVSAPASSTAGGTPGRLHAVAADLDAVARALAGKPPVAAVASAGLGGTPAQARARVAADILRRTPAQVASALRRARTQMPAAAARGMRDGGRELLRGTRALRGELRRMTRVTGTFVR